MSSTTINQAQVVTPTNPFAVALMEATEREEQAAAEAARISEAKRIEREANKAKFEAARQAEAARRQAREVQAWVHFHFFTKVAKVAKEKQWKPEAILQVQAYCEALVRQSDVELPKIDPTMEKIVRGRFAFALAMDHHGAQLIPEGFFLGQRQDWFPQLFELKVSDAERVRQQKSLGYVAG